MEAVVANSIGLVVCDAGVIVGDEDAGAFVKKLLTPRRARA